MPAYGPVIVFWSVVGLLLIIPAIPPAVRHKSWRWLFAAVFLSVAGIFFPLFVFLVSAALEPEWKGGCKHGWLDCFHIGKLALAPLVLWACAAFYMIQIYRPDNRSRKWMVLGVLTGAITSGICLVVGCYIVHPRDEMLWLLVPLYVTIWYSVLFVRTVRNSGIGVIAYVITLLSSIPFWIASVILSKQRFLSLPDQAPNCFVVTAAMRGHADVVGPFVSVERDGRMRRANRQLLTFWQFEAVWQKRSPRSHRLFRRVYNRIGPWIAARIRTRMAADVVYVCLKPFELITAAIVSKTCNFTMKVMK